LAAKKLGRCHSADRPTTATVRQVFRMRRSVLMSSAMAGILACGLQNAELVGVVLDLAGVELGQRGDAVLGPLARHAFAQGQVAFTAAPFALGEVGIDVAGVGRW
jgi:hypothetical protein